MKISLHKFPILKLVKNYLPIISPNNVIKIDPKHLNTVLEKKDFYNDLFIDICKDSLDSKNIFYITRNVFKAFDENKQVADKLWNLRNELDSEIGILLIPDGLSYFYAINNKRDENNVNAAVYCFKDNIFISFFFGFYNYNSINSGHPININLKYSFDVIGENKNYNVTYPLQTVVSYILFKNYADLEVKYVDGIKTKRCLLNSEKYINELDIPVTVIDSTWFTTIVHSEAFKVSGHFRLQPFGIGLKSRKLIYIDEYVKSGYTKTAKMLNQ